MLRVIQHTVETVFIWRQQYTTTNNRTLYGFHLREPEQLTHTTATAAAAVNGD